MFVSFRGPFPVFQVMFVLFGGVILPQHQVPGDRNFFLEIFILVVLVSSVSAFALIWPLVARKHLGDGRNCSSSNPYATSEASRRPPHGLPWVSPQASLRIPHAPPKSGGPFGFCVITPVVHPGIPYTPLWACRARPPSVSPMGPSNTVQESAQKYAHGGAMEVCPEVCPVICPESGPVICPETLMMWTGNPNDVDRKRKSGDRKIYVADLIIFIFLPSPRGPSRKLSGPTQTSFRSHQTEFPVPRPVPRNNFNSGPRNPFSGAIPGGIPGEISGAILGAITAGRHFAPRDGRVLWVV